MMVVLFCSICVKILTVNNINETYVSYVNNNLACLTRRPTFPGKTRQVVVYVLLSAEVN